MHKLAPSQIALIIISSMLASVFITLLLSFFLLRHKKLAKQDKSIQSDALKREKSAQQSPPRSLPIASSMSKRILAAGTSTQLPEQTPLEGPPPPPEMTAALTLSAFHPDNDAASTSLFASKLRDKLARLETSQTRQKSGSGGAGPRFYVPPSPPSLQSVSTGSVQQAKQVKFSTVRAVDNPPARLSEEEDDGQGGGFTVSRTVLRSASRKGSKAGGVRIGVRTWIEGGGGRGD
jgi:hypothetical protein